MKLRTERRKVRDELRRECDLSKWKGGIRGKYATRYQAGTNLVLLSLGSFLGDALGSTIALTDSTGAVQTSYAFEPFGTTTASGPAANSNTFAYTPLLS